MRTNFGAKPILYPQPVFIIGSYDEAGTPDAMNHTYHVLGERVGSAFQDGAALMGKERKTV